MISHRLTTVRTIYISFLAILVGVLATFMGWAFVHFIDFVTGVSFFQTFSFEHTSAMGNTMGIWIIFVPVIGGLLVGLIARFGSEGVRGHGIPEAMEQVLTNQSRVSPKLVFLKPLASAIAIGTGGPFGAEGPIIAAGGALGSLIGQFLEITNDERKTLLAAGAAAGVTAVFGSPVAGVLLAIELLLFEFRTQSLIPVALAGATAESVRLLIAGKVAPVFSIPILEPPTGTALACYIVLGAIVGLAAAFLTRTVHWIERQFERLPIHWMWWPAIGALVVGIIGFGFPQTLGAGYENIQAVLSGHVLLQGLLVLCLLKFISWAFGVGSGTSGGTLAPLFIVGSALGSLLGEAANHLFPQLGIDPRIAALVGMSALFAGASRALLASIAFAFETTLQPFSLLPLLGGCAGSFLISGLFIEHSIMTEKMARRGFYVPTEFSADFLSRQRVRDYATYNVTCLNANQTWKEVKQWIISKGKGASHQAFPVVNDQQEVLGVVTKKDLFLTALSEDQKISEFIKKPAIVIQENQTLREAADIMGLEKIGRLPVVDEKDGKKVVGILTRSNLLMAYQNRLQESRTTQRHIRLGGAKKTDAKKK